MGAAGRNGAALPLSWEKVVGVEARELGGWMSDGLDAGDLRAEVEVIGEDAEQAFTELVALDPREDFSGAVKLLEQVVRALTPLVPRMREAGMVEVARATREYLAQARALQETPEVEDPDEQAEGVDTFWEAVSAHVERVRNELIPLFPPVPAEPRTFPELLRAYEETAYVVSPLGDDSVRFELRVGDRSPELESLLGECRPPTVDWTIITAWNPRSMKQEGAVNAAAQRRLERRLKELGYRTWRALGVGTDGWQEESLFVHGLDLSEAQWLAREFEQVAVLSGRVGEPAELVLCGPRPVEHR
jgi:Protein of unknown function (DUF3293)